MNRRINKIILDMLHNKKNTLQGYAKLFQVSEQTIRNDIKEINSHFEKNNQAKILLDEVGELKMNVKVDLKETLKTYASFQNYNLTQDERRTILALLLITQNGFVTTYFLSEYVLVSRNTLLSDIEELKLWFARNDILLESYIGKGYLIKGDEEKIRNAMLKLIIYNGLFDQSYEYAFGVENDIFQNLLLDIIDKNTIYKGIKKRIIDSEKRCELQLSDFSYQEVCCYLLIMVERIKMGKIMTKTKNRKKLKNSSKYQFAIELCSFLEKDCTIQIPDNEIFYLTSILRSKSYIRNNSRKIDSIELQILINEFMFNVSKELNIKYYLNSDLFELLENHLKLLIYRIKQKNSVRNALFQEVYDAYKAIFPVVKTNLKNIEKFLKTKISNDEISFIVMYIMAILENNTSTQPFIRIRIICNSGRGTAQLLKEKMLSLFPQIDIVSVDSSHILSQLNPTSQELIVSTVPIETSSSPLIVVNPILTDHNIIELQKMIYQIRFKQSTIEEKKLAFTSKEQILYENYRSIVSKYIDEEQVNQLFSELEEIYSTYRNQQSKTKTTKEINRISEILTIQRVALDVQANNWQEAIKIAGELLFKDGFITENYIESMIRIVEENDSYIVIYPGVAIPHAEPTDGAFKTGASFIKLKEPICFNHKRNDPVKYVIAFSISESANIGSCLYYFTEILATGMFTEIMDKCQSSSEIIIELKKMEDTVRGVTTNEKIIM